MVIIQIPDEIRLIEKRRSPRISFGKDNKIEVVIKKYIGHEATPVEFTLRLIDISRSGMAIVVYSHDLALFGKDSKLTLDKVGDVQFTPDIDGVVVYARKMKRKKDAVSKVFRIGVSFLSDLSEQQLSSISKTLE